MDLEEKIWTPVTSGIALMLIVWKVTHSYYVNSLENKHKNQAKFCVVDAPLALQIHT